MNEQNQNKNKQETPKNNLGGASAANSSSGLRKLFAKRWVSPAIFMAAAAIIVTLMWIYQGAGDTEPTMGPDNGTEVSQGNEKDPGTSEEIVDVIASGEKMQWPVADASALQKETLYYDENASEAEKEAALIQYDSTFTPHTGIDFVDPNGAAFDVMAALSGTVTQVTQHPYNGNVVEISHGNGLVTVYQSLSDVQVEEGDEVEQNTIIAKAGRSDLERDHGIHLHFEARQNGSPINPNDYIAE
ncbi:peptidoglycan DD-metalloendopeptidase family protein [Paenibacillus sp. strain BS8-2]